MVELLTKWCQFNKQFLQSDQRPGAHNETPARVSWVQIVFQAGLKSVLIRRVKPEIRAYLVSSRGEARAPVQYPASPLAT